MPLYFGGLAEVTCWASVVDIGLHFVPDKPTQDSSESRAVTGMRKSVKGVKDPSPPLIWNNWPYIASKDVTQHSEVLEGYIL